MKKIIDTKNGVLNKGFHVYLFQDTYNFLIEYYNIRNISTYF